MIPVKLKKYKINELKGKLSNGKNVFIVLSEKKGKIFYNIDINLFRADLIKKLHSEKEYDKETYILTIEKYDTAYPGDKEANCIIDERLIFNHLRETIDYLDKKRFLKREDWIIDEK